MDKIQKKQEEEYDFPYHYVSQFRNGFNQSFNDTWGINYVSTIEYLIQRLKNEEFKTVIDIGCGDGRLVRELSIEFSEKRILGIDYSDHAVSLAKILNKGCEYYQADITSQIIEKADLVVLMEVFEHIPPEIADNFVEGIYNHLNENGILFITVPHQNKPVEFKHYRHFSNETISKCFSEKFIIEEIIPFESNGIRKRLIDKILTNRFFILNSQKLKNYFYKYYKNNLFLLDNDESKCNRIFIKAIKK
jgi:2-polyprenyl-3-methyl-5-hydroxy-6-metoxy-1,4-benzoquinol methylase